MFWITNYVRLFVTGNPDWLVPASFEERRFAVLDMGDDHMKDIPYFAAIDEEMANGGREALLHHLLFEVDCSKVDLRQIPHTAALLEQKFESATTEQSWWLDILFNGVLPGDGDGSGELPSELLFEHYIERAKNKGVSHRAIETQLGMFLHKYVKGLQRRKKTYWLRDGRGRVVKKCAPVYQFPLLWRCRKQFSRQINEPVNWGEVLGHWSPDEAYPPMKGLRWTMSSSPSTGRDGGR